MDFITHIREAFTNLVSAKLRSFLAILGILVGTGSVVALISSSQLATQNALAQFKTLGTNLLAMDLIQPDLGGGGVEQKKNLTLDDMNYVRHASTEIIRVAPYTSLYQTLVLGDQSFGVQILGSTEDLQEIVKIKLQRGRFVSLLDKNNMFCVIGDKLAQKIMQTGVDPLNKQIRVGTQYFTVIGIAKSWKPNLFLFADIDNGLIVPLPTSYLISKSTQISNVLFRLIQRPDLNEVQRQLTEVMKRIVPSKQARFRDPEQIIKIVAEQRKTFTWLLGAIGGISLLVGGIGVMNIMLVSVVERRREIGIRMAIGAQKSDILQMFLIESVILTIFGGILGILIGVGVSYGISLASNWAFQLLLLPPSLGFIVSVLVGIISGFYPALRAANLDPIQTLQGD